MTMAWLHHPLPYILASLPFGDSLVSHPGDPRRDVVVRLPMRGSWSSLPVDRAVPVGRRRNS